MLLNNSKANPGKQSILDQTIDALLSLPEYKQYTRDDVTSYLDAIEYKESGGKNITQNGGGPASGYFQIEDASMPYASLGLKAISKRSGKALPEVNAQRGMALSRDEQAALSLAHDYSQGVAYKKPMNFFDQKNTWLDNHWVGKRDAGYTKKREEYGKSWDNVMINFKGRKTENKEMYSQLIRPFNTLRLVDINKTVDDPLNYGKRDAVVK